MNRDKPTEARFLECIEDHKIKIIKDDGIYRHVKFSKENSNVYSFELITWPGYLTICGDMGSYTFQRLEDMFMFFRCCEELKEGDFKDKLYINPCYWHEKLIGICRRSGAERFSESAFHENIKNYFETAFEGGEDATLKSDCWDAIVNELLDGEYQNEFEAQMAVSNFQYMDFEFTDFWEYSSQDYTYHFIWCLYAIAYGVREYDKVEE